MSLLMNSITNKLYIFSFLGLFLLGCNKLYHEKFDEKLIQKISSENGDLPSKMFSISFYGKCTDDKIAEVHIQDLRSLHKFKWMDLSYKEFLDQALNQKINLEYQDKIECFDLDKEIAYHYKNTNFNTFLNLYTKNSSNNELTLKSTIKENQINSVSYYFFST
jgi:hypothetical protein